MSEKIQVKCMAAILVLAFSTMAQAETPVVKWICQLGSVGNDFGNGVSVDGSGNAYVAGWTGGSLDGNTSAGDCDIFLTKFDTNGKKIWTKQLGTTSNDRGNGVTVDGSGNAYVTGRTRGSLDGNTNAGDYDMFLTKYNTDGTKLWTRQLGTNRYDEGNGVSVDGSGNAYVTGYTWGGLDGNISAGGVDMFLTKFNTDGTKLWTRQLSTGRSEGNGVSVDGSGNAYIAGRIGGGLDGNISAGGIDIYLTKYDTDGAKLWTRQLGTASTDEGYGVSVDSSGNSYVTGRTDGGLDDNPNAGGLDMFLTKYDTAGTKLWTRILGTAHSDISCDVSVDGRGNAYVTGWTNGSLSGNTNAGRSDMFLTKYAPDGTKLWIIQLGSANSDGGHGVSVDGSGNAYVTGYTLGSLTGNASAGGFDIFLVKISSDP